MPKLSPQQAGEKLARKIQAAGTDYQNGVNAVSVNPAQLAMAANDKWVAGIQDAIQNDRFRKGLSTVTLQDWKDATLTVGVQRFTSSGAKAQKNYTKFAQEFFPYLDTVQNEIDAMPNLTFQDSINRMIRNAERLHEFKNR